MSAAVSNRCSQLGAGDTVRAENFVDALLSRRPCLTYHCEAQVRQTSRRSHSSLRGLRAMSVPLPPRWAPKLVPPSVIVRRSPVHTLTGIVAVSTWLRHQLSGWNPKQLYRAYRIRVAPCPVESLKNCYPSNRATVSPGGAFRMTRNQQNSAKSLCV